jgi:hypothetical protein
MGSLAKNVLHGLDRGSSNENLDDVRTEPPVVAKEGMPFWHGIDILVQELQGHIFRVLGQRLVADQAGTACLQEATDHRIDNLRITDNTRPQQLRPAMEYGYRHDKTRIA